MENGFIRLFYKKKKRIISSVACFCIALLSVFAFSACATPSDTIRITCVGDSLTYGSGILKTRDRDSYPAQLQTMLGNGHKVSGFGLRNATASNAGDLPYIESKEYAAALKSDPDIVFVMLGTNDSKTYNWDPESYKQGLEEIVRSFAELPGEPRVILLRSPWCFSLDGGEIAEFEIQPTVVESEVGEAIKEIAFDTDTTVVDLFEVTRGQKDLYTDGIHFNAEGYRLIAETLSAALSSN